MKSLAIMQPYLFPYIGYFQLLKAVDQYVVYDDVQFIKGGWINRNNILIGGKSVLFTIPLTGASPNKLINEVEINNEFEKFIKTVSMAYSKAPYKEDVLKLIEKIAAYPDKNLANFILNSLQEISTYLAIKTPIIKSSDIDKNNQLKSQDKVIDICKTLEASRYINPIGGQGLYDKKSFLGEGIELYFIKANIKEYKQFKNDFIPGLSIIDVLMFNSPERVNEMLDDYELI